MEDQYETIRWNIEEILLHKLDVPTRGLCQRTGCLSLVALCSNARKIHPPLAPSLRCALMRRFRSPSIARKVRSAYCLVGMSTSLAL
jgi:hypothetical protein